MTEQELLEAIERLRVEIADLKERLELPRVERAWFSTDEVAEKLGCSTKTVIRRIRTGEMRAKIDGGKYKVQPNDLDEYVGRRKPISRRKVKA